MTLEKPPITGPLRCDAAQNASSNGPADASGGGANGTGGLQVRFCGGCNPFIDRVGVADAVRAGLAEAGVNGVPGATLYVSGCQRACASSHRLTDEDEATAVVVAGESVDATPTAAAQIPITVLSKIRPQAAPSPSGSPARQKQRDIADEG